MKHEMLQSNITVLQGLVNLYTCNVMATFLQIDHLESRLKQHGCTDELGNHMNENDNWKKEDCTSCWCKVWIEVQIIFSCSMKNIYSVW